MNNFSLQQNPQTPVKPQGVPGKENIPKQPQTNPPGDIPLQPIDPTQQPID